MKVLDHGFVRLVDSMGDDTSIVRSARVSYDAEWRAGDDKGSDRRLLRYLWNNGHTSPFEAVTATFEVKAPIFVARQWMRHRTQSYNEVSARYTELPEEIYVPALDQITTQSTDNKQMRTDQVHTEAQKIQNCIRETDQSQFDAYKVLLEMGCPRELARGVLPVNTYTHFFATANLNNWLKFLNERQHEHAQYEIRVYADAINELLKNIVPETMEIYTG